MSISREFDELYLKKFHAYASTRPNAGHQFQERDHSCNLRAAGEHIPFPSPGWRTMSTAMQGIVGKCVLGNVIIRFEAAMMEVLELVDPRIDIMCKGPVGHFEKKGKRKVSQTASCNANSRTLP